jgi:hypothetical protein
MIFVIVILSILIFAAGFIVTESNARYLLSGYKRMTAGEKEQMDLRSYVQFGRRFHIFLSINYLIFSIALFRLVDENAAGIFMIIFPIAAYLYFIIESRNFPNSSGGKALAAGVVVLAFCVILVAYLTVNGLKPNEFKFTDTKLIIKGTYGMEIPFDEITAIELSAELPEIKKKRHGYAMGDILKGEFKTIDKVLIKVIADKRFAPYVKITTIKGRDIYLTSVDYSPDEILRRVSPEVR